MRTGTFKKKQILLLLLLTVTHLTLQDEEKKFKLKKDVKLNIKYELHKSQEKKVETAENSLGFLWAEVSLTRTDKISENVQWIHLFPDLTSTEIITKYESDPEKKEWGITCMKKETDLCVLSENETQGSYRGVSYSYYPAQTVSSLSDSFSFKDATPNLNVRLLTKLTATGSTWPFKGSGVIGLAKKSDFVNYVISQYETQDKKTKKDDKKDEKKDDKKKEDNDAKEFVFSFNMKVNPQNENDRFEGKEKGTFDDSFISINGYSDNVLVKGSEIPWLKSTDSHLWSIDSIKVSAKQDDNNKKQISDGLSCLLSESPGMLVLPRDKIPEIKKDIMKKLCGADTCGKKNTDITKGPTLYFEFKDSEGNEKNFEVKPERYIWAKENEDLLQVAFDELENYQTFGKCPQGSVVGFGRLFFVEKYLMFKRIETEATVVSYQIGVGDKVDVDDLSEIFLVYSISLGILGTMVLIFILKTACLWNRNKGTDDDGAEEDADYSKV